MNHVPPHRWADFWAGKVSAAEREQMTRHVQQCAVCARGRTRVRRASDSFGAIRAQAAPDVAWDTVRAKVHWSVSTERRAKIATDRRRPLLRWGAIAAGSAAALAVAVATGPMAVRPRPAPIATAPAAAPVVAHEMARAATVARPAPLVGLVSLASGDVLIDGARRTDLFAQPLGAHSAIATGEGRVHVQFGDGSAFALAPHSTLAIERFDAQLVQLDVTGTVDIEVAPRAPGQRFLVEAGDRTIEVRGTQFRVSHSADGAAAVACLHGLVAVRDDAGELQVGAARRVALRRGRAVTAEKVVALSSDEIAQLQQAKPLALPVWSTLAASSAPLEIAAVGHRDVRIDGVELGAAPLRVRVMPGRHGVEAADAAGRYRRAGWIDVSTNAARFEVPADAPPTGALTARKKEFRAGIDRARLSACTRSLAKAGLTGTYVQIDIAIDAGGAVNALNIVDSDLGAATQGCVRDALAEVHFAPGAAASWHERIDL